MLKVMQIKISLEPTASFDVIQYESSMKYQRYPNRASREYLLEDALNWLEGEGWNIEDIMFIPEGYYQVVVRKKEKAELYSGSPFLGE